ncbi:nuclear transport factor 2 family protein [Herbiconiux solani]|uniref:nuclear transport factor 2 family protein n=1 Tax=Herbiconiux solani TaxID=661329 RepID=UPI000826A9A8|nr:nuclear transport factor 2 family protein [Herbiconiux solani]
MSAKDIVIEATEQLFNRKDTAILDQVFGPVYVQHSALGADGVDGLKVLVSSLPETAGYTLTRIIADGGLVVTEGEFTGFAPVPLTGYDVWRVVDDRIVEHWDALGAAATHSATLDVQTGGDTVAANRALVTEWVARALVSGDHRADEDYLAPGAGVAYDEDLVYRTVHAVIADQDVVYTRSEGEKNGPVIINDMWRVTDGRIVEHWSLMTPVPESLPHGNGAF